MKTIFFSTLIALFAFAPTVDEKDRLNKLLDDRVKINKEILKENLESHDVSPNADQWKKIEKDSSAALLELVEYCKKSDDNKLKRLMLKNEYYMEIIYSMGEIEFANESKEFAETDAEKIELEKTVADSKKNVDEFKTKIAELGDSVN